jgi:hypothetical protein
VSERANPYRDWLGIAAGQPPASHYDLFGLKPLENDPLRIQAAIDSVVERVRGLRVPREDFIQWQYLLQQISVGQVCLTDPAAKREYDAQLRSAAGRAPSATAYPIAPPPPAAPTAVPPPTLPNGSRSPGTAPPHSPLAPGYGSLSRPDRPQTPWEKAMARAAEKAAVAAAVPEPPVPQVSWLQSQQPPLADFSQNAPAAPIADSTYAPAALPDAVPAEVFVAVADANLTRRRYRGSGPALLMLFVTFLALGGAGYYLYRQGLIPQFGQPPPPVLDREALDRGAVSPFATPVSVSPSSIIASGKNPSASEKASLPTAEKKVGNAIAPAKPPASSASTKPVLAGKTPAKPPEKLKNEKKPVAAVDAAKQAALHKSLAETVAALSRRDVGRAQELLAQARTNAQSPEDHGLVTRYENLGDYVREFWRLIRDRIDHLRPTEELELGKTRVVIVESQGGQFSFRSGGKIFKYQIDTMPSWMVIALADANLASDPQSKVIYGSFLAVDPAGNRQRAQELWAEASRQGGQVDIKTDQLLPSIESLPPVGR